jgi:hypothetical protein
MREETMSTKPVRYGKPPISPTWDDRKIARLLVLAVSVCVGLAGCGESSPTCSGESCTDEDLDRAFESALEEMQADGIEVGPESVEACFSGCLT